MILSRVYALVKHHLKVFQQNNRRVSGIIIYILGINSYPISLYCFTVVLIIEKNLNFHWFYVHSSLKQRFCII